ncbi:MAG: alpha/beta hydrolase, partial [Ancalomicrobiaceae bacterium]|nr:alpha/beta hydrolase [Ancalomicrobiaceae bacterium]
SPLNINNPIGNGRPCTYIACTNPWMPTMASSQDWVRKQPNWKWLELATAHDAMITAPAELTAMLAAIG